MAEGFKIADGFVLVNVTLDERQADEMGAKAAERVAKQIEDSPELKRAAEAAGKKTGETLGDEAAKGADEKLKAAKDKFTKTGGDTGRESGKKFGDEFAMAAALGVVGSDVFKGKQLSGAGSFSNVILGDTERLGKDIEREGVKLGEHVSAGFLSRLGTKLMGDGQSTGLFSTINKALGQGSSKFVEGLSSLPWVGAIFKPISDAIGSMPPQAQAAIGAGIAMAITASAAVIGAALNGVLLAAIGLGGIAAGIVGQISNPVVHDALAGLGQDFISMFHSATSSFAEPLVNASGIFGKALHDIMPGLTADFDKLAHFVEPLTQGFANLLVNIMPGLSKAFDAAGPILLELAAQLPGLGHAISDMFSSLSGGERGAVEGLRTLFLILDTTLRITGQLIEGLSKVYSAIVAAGDAWSGWIAKIPGLGVGAMLIHNIFNNIRTGSTDAGSGVVVFGKALTAAGADAALSATDISKLIQQITQVKPTVDMAAGAMADKMFNALMGMDQATLGVYEAQTKLGDTLKANGLAIDKHTGQIAFNTAKGQQNREAVLSQVAANIKVYDSQIALGISAHDAAAAYDQNTKALHDQLRQAGLTEKQVNSLIGTYGSVPDHVNTDIIMKGLADAIGGLDETLRLINGLDGRKATTTIETIHVSRNTNTPMRHGGVVFAAAGLVSGIMPEQDPPAVYFAEKGTGGEIFAPLQGISQARAVSLGQTLGDAYDFDVKPRTSPPSSSAHSPQGHAAAAPTMHGPYNIHLGDRPLMSMVIDAISGNPTVVSIAASEGDRLRGGMLPGFRPGGR